MYYETPIYSRSGTIGPKQIEKLAAEAALSAPMLRTRVVELAETVIGALPAVTPEIPFAAALGRQIQSRCQRIIQRFRK